MRKQLKACKNNTWCLALGVLLSLFAALSVTDTKAIAATTKNVNAARYESKAKQLKSKVRYYVTQTSREGYFKIKAAESGTHVFTVSSFEGTSGTADYAYYEISDRNNKRMSGETQGGKHNRFYIGTKSWYNNMVQWGSIKPSNYSTVDDLTSRSAKIYLQKGKIYTFYFCSRTDANTTYTLTFRNLDKREQVITAKDLKIAANGKTQTKKLPFKAKGGAQLSYKLTSSKLKVQNGKLIIPASYVGKSTMTITAQATGTYKRAAVKITVQVLPQNTAITGQMYNQEIGSVLLRWKAVKYTNRYELQASLYKNFRKAQTVSTSALNAIVNVTSGKTYYFRIRTRRIVNGKKVYSAWSKTLSKTF